MGAAAGIRVSEIPADFCPVFVQTEDKVVCYGYAGITVELGVELTPDPCENARRVERLRNAVYWYLELKRQGIDPESGGTA